MDEELLHLLRRLACAARDAVDDCEEDPHTGEATMPPDSYVALCDVLDEWRMAEEKRGRIV